MTRPPLCATDEKRRVVGHQRAGWRDPRAQAFPGANALWSCRTLLDRRATRRRALEVLAGRAAEGSEMRFWEFPFGVEVKALSMSIPPSCL
jgi:hypothetical protein